MWTVSRVLLSYSFNSVEKVKVNHRVWLCYRSKVHHNFAQSRFEFFFYAEDFQKSTLKYFFTSVIFLVLGKRSIKRNFFVSAAYKATYIPSNIDGAFYSNNKVMVYTLGLICWLEKVLFWKSELYTLKYTLNPLLCQNMVNFTPMPKLGTHQDLEEPVFNALKTVRISVVIFQCEGFSSKYNQLEMLLFSTQTSRRKKNSFSFFIWKYWCPSEKLKC